MRISSLAFVGAGKATASIEFGAGLTVVRGPSDTGKSFIVDALDFMMGAQSLKEIPELPGYSSALLTLAFGDGSEPVTLVRAISGGPFAVYAGALTSIPNEPPDQELAAKHNANSDANISRFLLKRCGLDGRRVRKNVRNETDSLSFRNVAHLCIVNETAMQDTVAPALTGSYTTKTKEISVLRMLLEDEDDSNLVVAPDKAATSRTSSAQVEVIDRLIADLAGELTDAPPSDELLVQLERLDATVDQLGGSIEGLAQSRDELARRHIRLQRESADLQKRLEEAITLHGRLSLLRDQYASDLSRLELVGEAGSLLGLMEPGICIFCGAESEHQTYNHPFLGESTNFSEAVRAEIAKTTILRDDLAATMVGLAGQRSDLTLRLDSVSQLARSAAENLLEADRSLRPHRDALSEVIAARTKVMKLVDGHTRVADLEKMKQLILTTASQEAATVAQGVSLVAVREFSEVLSRTLKTWGYEQSAEVRYDRNEQDIVAGDQLRAAHGKGVRAILHAAFTVSLAEYCHQRGIAHPGFVVLDSPLVTYRPPGPTDEADAEVVDEEVSPDFVEAFYDSIRAATDLQVIVMENVDPPNPLGSSAVDVEFTKVEGHGRYGFFPVDPR